MQGDRYVELLRPHNAPSHFGKERKGALVPSDVVSNDTFSKVRLAKVCKVNRLLLGPRPQRTYYYPCFDSNVTLLSLSYSRYHRLQCFPWAQPLEGVQRRAETNLDEENVVVS